MCPRLTIVVDGTVSQRRFPSPETLWMQRFETAGVVFERAAERGEIVPVADPAEWVERLVGPIHFRVNQIGGDASEQFIDALVSRLLAELPQ